MPQSAQTGRGSDPLLQELDGKAGKLGLRVQVVRYGKPYYQVFKAGQMLLSVVEDHAPYTIRLFLTMVSRDK